MFFVFFLTSLPYSVRALIHRRYFFSFSFFSLLSFLVVIVELKTRDDCFNKVSGKVNTVVSKKKTSAIEPLLLLFFSFPSFIIPLSPYYLCLTCLTSTNHRTTTKKKGTAFKRSYAMQLITLLKPAAAQCGLPNEAHKTKHHAVPMVTVIFVCENDAA